MDAWGAIGGRGMVWDWACAYTLERGVCMVVHGLRFGIHMRSAQDLPILFYYHDTKMSHGIDEGAHDPSSEVCLQSRQQLPVGFVARVTLLRQTVVYAHRAADISLLQSMRLKTAGGTGGKHEAPVSDPEFRNK